MKISNKILVLFGSAILVLVAAFCIFGNYVLTDYAEKAMLEELRSAAQTVNTAVDDQVRLLTAVSKAIEMNADLPKAVMDKDFETIKTIAKNLWGFPGITLVTICDTETTVLARAHSDKAGDKLGAQRMSAYIPLKEGRIVTGMEPGNITKLTLASGIPLKQNGVVVGAVILGINFETNEFVDELKKDSDSEYTVFLDDTRISTTIMSQGQRVVGTKLTNTAIYERVMKKGETVFAVNSIAGKEYNTIYWPWKDMQGKIAGISFVGKPRELFLEARQSTTVLFIGTGLVFGLIAMLAAFFTAQAIARPLRAATAYAEDIARGDFSRHIASSSKDEVGSLIRSMNQIPEALHRLITSAGSVSNGIRRGMFRERLDAGSFEGGYREMAIAVNTVSDAYTATIDALPVPIMGCAADHKVIFLNGSAQSAVGAGLLGESCARLDTGGAVTVSGLGKETMQTGSGVTGETALITQTGQIEVAVSTMPLRNAEGEIAGYFEIFSDITTIKGQQRTMLEVADKASTISDRVAAASEELAAQIEQVARGAEAQREQMDSTVSAMDQMNSTVLEVARSAGQAADQSEGSRQRADDGAGMVNQVVEAVNKVNGVAVTLQDNMGELGSLAESIGGVMNVISDIADQTNLLALNAAIEAARAGDAGRGFAVVADEVRKLAEKTMSATHEVGSSITAIQQSARTNIEEVGNAVKNVAEATKLAHSSGEALENIVSLASSSSSVVASIATAAEEQSATSEEISRTLGAINSVAAETAEGTAQAAEAVRELSRMSQELRSIIAHLK